MQTGHCGQSNCNGSSVEVYCRFDENDFNNILFFQEPSIVRDAFPHPSLARNINTGFDILDIDTTM